MPCPKFVVRVREKALERQHHFQGAITVFHFEVELAKQLFFWVFIIF